MQEVPVLPTRYMAGENDFPLIAQSNRKPATSESTSEDIAIASTSQVKEKENRWVTGKKTSGGTAKGEGGEESLPVSDREQSEIQNLRDIMKSMEEQHRKQMEDLEEKHLAIVSQLTEENRKVTENVSTLVGLVENLLSSNVTKPYISSDVNVNSIDDKWNAVDKSFYQKDNTKKAIFGEAILPPGFTATRVKKSVNKMPEGEQAKVVWAVHQVQQFRDFVIDICKNHDHGFSD